MSSSLLSSSSTRRYFVHRRNSTFDNWSSKGADSDSLGHRRAPRPSSTPAHLFTQVCGDFHLSLALALRSFSLVPSPPPPSSLPLLPFASSPAEMVYRCFALDRTIGSSHSAQTLHFHLAPGRAVITSRTSSRSIALIEWSITNRDRLRPLSSRRLFWHCCVKYTFTNTRRSHKFSALMWTFPLSASTTFALIGAILLGSTESFYPGWAVFISPVFISLGSVEYRNGATIFALSLAAICINNAKKVPRGLEEERGRRRL